MDGGSQLAGGRGVQFELDPLDDDPATDEVEERRRPALPDPGVLGELEDRAYSGFRLYGQVGVGGEGGRQDGPGTATQPVGAIVGQDDDRSPRRPGEDVMEILGR